MNTKTRSHRYPKPEEYLDTTYYDKSKGLLDIGYQKLRALPSYDYKLITMLMVDFNSLTDLPDMPNLTYLSCEKNKLTRLKYYPKLTYLNAAGNKIARLPKEYQNSKLEWVDLAENGFTLDVMLPKCIRLYLNGNDLKDFDFKYSPSVRYLDVSENKLSRLNGNDKLLELHVQYNNLSKLNSYPNLKHLNAKCNDLISIALLPKIDTMEVSHNKLTEIYQPSLTSLIARKNCLTKLPYHESLTYLDIAHNQITNLVIPNVVSCFINDNPLTYVKGQLTKLEQITLDYSTYRMLYPQIKARIIALENTVIADKLDMFDDAIIARLEECKLGWHEPVIRSIAKRLNKPFESIKESYYSSLVIVISLST